LSDFDANVGSILARLADLTAEHHFRSEDVKIQLLKALRDIEYRSSIAVNEEWLLDHLIAAYFTACQGQ
jgi:hypothetical protein